MTETDTPPVMVPTSVDDNLLTSENGDTTDAEHEDSGDHHSNGDLHLEDLKPSTNQETHSADTPSEQTPRKVANSKNAASIKKSETMSVDPSKKENGSPPTPTVKKIINSGTFGAGSVKPAGTKGPASATPVVTKLNPPALKKPTTSAPGPTSKPTLASSLSSKPSVTAAASTRRASVVPTRTAAPPPVRPSLSASASAKPPSESAALRSSVASPTGSVGSVKAGSATPAARPRASVSEAVKKAPISSRPSVTSSTRTTVPAKSTTVSRSSAVAPPAKSSRVTGSISSITEIKEDGKALGELQSQLAEATKSLEAKGVAVSDLESQIEKLVLSLATASGELDARAASVAESEKAREAAESELQEAQTSLSKVQEDLQSVTSTLQSVQAELETAKSSALAQDDTVQELGSRIQELEGSITTSKEQIELLERNRAVAATSAAEAVLLEHEALLTAQANFKAVSEELERLKVVHTKALQDSENHLAELREKLGSTEALEAQVSSLKAEKEESANKLSELEVEILELKEIQDGLEDTRDRLQRQIATLEDELAKAAVATGLAAEVASDKEAAYSQQVEELARKHEEELEEASTRYTEIVASLKALKAQHSEAVAAKEHAENDVLEKEKQHVSTISELEQTHATQQVALTADLEKISQELQNQESIYNAKVDIVKKEHEKLLLEAFERAKNEAAQVHSQELQTLRSNSNATIEQIQASNQVTIDALKAEHESSLETVSNSLQKQINKFNLELKATQDDLAKAKASLDASHAEAESLTQQLQAARAQADTVPALSPEHADEIARLRQELSNTKDDLAAVTDMLNLTKSSMTELSDKHTAEMEDGAKTRADEILKLRSAHDEELNTLAVQKSDLLIKLSDLEGELQTARASLEAQQTASPKSNGTVHSPASPGVTKEELTKMHEAHNLKIYDIQAEHEKAMKLAKEELETAFTKIGELQQDLARKAMEIEYLEQDQDESQEQITRLKEDVERLGQEQS